jgi:trimeric autotransporter adhesin
VTTNKHNPNQYKIKHNIFVIFLCLLIPNFPALAASAYSDVIQNADRPRIYYRLGEASGDTAFDSSTNNSNATYNGGPLLNQAGAIKKDLNTAVTFDGVDDYAVWNPTSGYTGEFTVEAWIKPATIDDYFSPKTFLSTRGPFGEYSFDLKLYQGHLYLDVGNGWQWLWNGGLPFNYQAGEWYHVAAVVAPAVLDTCGPQEDTEFYYASLYVNGKLLGNVDFWSPGTPLLFDEAHSLYIGTVIFYNNEWFNGSIDEVAIYTKALSQQSINAHYILGSKP